jgi:hypothetical protein
LNSAVAISFPAGWRHPKRHRVLDERPPAIDWLATAVISLGVYAVSGGPWPTLERGGLFLSKR